MNKTAHTWNHSLTTRVGIAKVNCLANNGAKAGSCYRLYGILQCACIPAHIPSIEFNNHRYPRGRKEKNIDIFLSPMFSKTSISFSPQNHRNVDIRNRDIENSLHVDTLPGLTDIGYTSALEKTWIPYTVYYRLHHPPYTVNMSTIIMHTSSYQALSGSGTWAKWEWPAGTVTVFGRKLRAFFRLEGFFCWGLLHSTERFQRHIIWSSEFEVYIP